VRFAEAILKSKCGIRNADYYPNIILKVADMRLDGESCLVNAAIQTLEALEGE
jgi:hypothetical protein